jgi:hypothetical protein
MSAVEPAVEAWAAAPVLHREWVTLSARTPQLAATMRRYLIQLSTCLAPRSVDAADNTLRQFALRGHRSCRAEQAAEFVQGSPDP